MQWTPEQLWAIRTDRHTVVTASAGSGKTAVLVERYIHLLFSGVMPQDIVAITFTRKAAAEMYARIAAELERRIAAATTPQELSWLKPLRERLMDAPISTIHSFCAQLLRRFPIEAEVLPDFSELTEAEAERLAQEVALHVVEELLNAGDPQVWAFVRQYGRRETLLLVILALRNVEQLVFLEALLRRPWQERLCQAQQQFLFLFERALQELLRVLQQGIEEAERSETAQRQASVGQRAQVRALCTQLQQALSVVGQEQVEELLRLWQELRDQAFRKDGYPRSGVVGESSFIPVKLHAIARLLDELAQAWQHRHRDAELFQQMDVLYRIVTAVVERLELEKRSRNVLDFNDLQLKALHLLEQPAVIERLRREIRYLLVDEFQDTNPVQYALVRRLLELEHDTGWIGPQVFLVGDPKQSIYGFRGADVRVFERARSELVRRNRWAMEKGLLLSLGSEPRDTGDIHLPVSFRLAPEIVAFVNRVSASLFEQAPGQVAYEPLLCGRPEGKGSVRFLVALESGANDSAGSLTEEELIARSILQWVYGEQPLLVGEWSAVQGCEVHRPARYRDIAILARYRLSVPRLTAVLQRYGIPYVVHAGAGFFQTPEVQDFYFLLRFLLNERDDVALAVVLRSPLFALRDEHLLSVALTEGGSFWEKLCRRAEVEGAGSELHRVVETLRLLRLLQPRLSLAELLRTVGERTLWLLRLRHHPRFAQIQANVQKLLEFARSFQARGFRTLADFVEELGALIEAEVPETEAVLPIGMDAVNILTIHAAKGLEFPIVVLYRMAETRWKTQPLLIDETAGLLTQLQQWDEESGIWRPLLTPAYVSARYADELRRQAEEQRVLYVGLTRARDHLVLSGTLTLTKDGTVSLPKGLLGFVLEGLGIAPLELARSSELSFSTELTLVGADGGRLCSAVKLPVPIVRDVPVVTPSKPHPPVGPAPIILLEPVPVRWSQERLSATHYALFRRWPESFLRRAILGFPATPEEMLYGTIVPSEHERELPEPLILGYLLHQLLAHVLLWTTAEGIPVPERLRQLAHALVMQSPYGSAFATEEWLCERAHAVVSTPFVQRSWDAFRRALREYALTVPLGENFLTGTMDVLLPTEEGWEIWDWKMGAVRNPEECAALAQLYEPQLQVYAYLVLRRFPEQSRISARLLFVEAAHAGIADEHWIWSRCWERAEIIALEPEFHSVAQRLFVLGTGGDT